MCKAHIARHLITVFALKVVDVAAARIVVVACLVVARGGLAISRRGRGPPPIPLLHHAQRFQKPLNPGTALN